MLCFTAPAETLHFVTKISPPLNWEEKGQSIGPMIDILQATCKSLGITCTIQTMPWRRALLMVEDGQAEGLFALAISPDRIAQFYLSEPLIVSAYSFFGLNNNNFHYHKPEDLIGHTIVVYGPSNTQTVLEHALKDIKGVSIIIEKDDLTLLRKLAEGRYGQEALAFMNRDIGENLCQSQHILEIKPIADYSSVYYSIGLSRKAVSESNANRFFNTVHILNKSGKIAEILKKWKLTPAIKPQ
ncbi:ABC transporter substrate-binding protein [Chromobacterium sp. ATCC 53434]|uniref:substrate-binding periplasmic protein n=1 Tax=Chromobacterium sp. (strain ATCC 53434 / SC 14030) TaxID=2059672 RepID=UPI001F3E357C|nr:transporter substrate-binding domain-containing protein [Chromobacterium sp. ATCC 53434]